jgi:flagellar assembly factor FliW
LALTIESSRFGRVEIDPGSVIEFTEGLIGLGGSRFALLTRDRESAFSWLQSLEDPGLALPVINPHHFFAGYEVELIEEDAERLGADPEAPVDVYLTVCAAATLEEFTANQKAPILVWSGRGYQIINQAPGCELRAPLFAGVDVQPAADPAC